ncbi:MAG: DNA topoisomerase IV subunit B, partial [Clostridiales bacterium]|nr:DNA topoisomerase IV subunit B [Clostridiales bacterium]
VKESVYLYNDFELEKMRKNSEYKILNIQRYKGLGEMDAHQLWETTLNPETRTLAQISISDHLEADEITNILMSSNVPPRRTFIMEEAKYARLDI